jgi:predicted transcriptional regulator
MLSSVMIHFKMPCADVKRLDEIAERLSESRSTLIRRSIHEFLDRMDFGDSGVLEK